LEGDHESFREAVSVLDAQARRAERLIAVLKIQYRISILLSHGNQENSLPHMFSTDI